MAGLRKAKKYDWKDSNLALFGSDTEKNVGLQNCFLCRFSKIVIVLFFPVIYTYRLRKHQLKLSLLGKMPGRNQVFRFGGS